MIRGVEKMKNKTLTVAFVVLLVLSCLNVFTVYAFASKPEFRRVIIGFKERPSNSLIEGLGGTIKYTYNVIPAIACSLPVQAIEALRNNPQIEYIDEDVIISVTRKPDKPDNPSKPPKSPKVGYIEVRSFVESSEVPLPYKVNGVWTGVTPDTIERVPATYTVAISYGDETEDQLIEVSSRKTSLAYFQFTEIPPPPPPLEQGTLQIITTPITDGEIFINTVSEGLAPVTKDVDIGSYTISFGTVSGYTSPDPQTVAVYENQIAYVEGVYQLITPPPSIIPWGIDRIDADLAWNTSTGKNVQVAILDTGIDKDHPYLQDNILAGISFVYYSIPFLWNPNAWDDDMGHGTWCAGIVKATAPDVDLVAVKVMDAMGYGYTSDVIAGIEWCMDNLIDVISMSFVDPVYSNAFNNICSIAYVQEGIVLVGASGNDGDGDPSTNEVYYPAKYDAVIAVSGIDENDVVVSFSADGAENEITAPAVNINSTWMGGGYATHDGTSGACPHVSGTVALVLSLDINLPQFSGYDLDSDGTWDSWEVRNRLLDTADELGDAGRDVFFGYGLVDAQEAVTGVQTTP
jgi:subtilisin family serine protease